MSEDEESGNEDQDQTSKKPESKYLLYEQMKEVLFSFILFKIKRNLRVVVIFKVWKKNQNRVTKKLHNPNIKS